MTTFYTFMLSTGSCRANVHNSGLSKQIGAFCVTRLTMILRASPTPLVVHQARRSVRGGPHTSQMPLCEAETALSTFLNGRGSCEVPCHKTGVMPGSAAGTYHDLELNMNVNFSHRNIPYDRVRNEVDLKLLEGHR